MPCVFYLLCFLAIPPKFTYYAHSGTYYAQNYAQKMKCIVKVKVHVLHSYVTQLVGLSVHCYLYYYLVKYLTDLIMVN